MCLLVAIEGTGGSTQRNMSSSAGGLGLEKNVFTQNSSGTYFSSCEDKFPLLLSKLGSLHFLWFITIGIGIILYHLQFMRQTNILCDSDNDDDCKILEAKNLRSVISLNTEMGPHLRGL